MEGLEISVINKQELEIENHTRRFDSEYLQKRYLENLQIIKRKGFNQLSDYIEHLSGGATPLGANYKLEGIPFLRVQNIMQNYFNLNDVVHLNNKQDEEIKRSRLKLKDVLLTITGSYGKSSTVNLELEGANINQHSVKITLNKKLNPYFLSTFLNSKYGKLQSDKNIVGVTRPALDYKVIRNFYIPNIEHNFQIKIEELLLQAETKIKSSKQTYTQAEQILLEEIGLQDFDLSNSPPSEGWQSETDGVVSVNIKNFKDSFGTSGRLDAEYYQKKYERIENAVKSYSNGFEILNAFIDNFSTGYPYKSNSYIKKGGVPLIRINNIKKGSLNLSNAIEIPKSDLELSVKDIAYENDILISMSGTIGNSCKIPRGIKAVVNQRIMKITPKNFNFEVLPLVINSLIGQLQLNRIGTGGVQTNISSTDIRKIFIPKIKENKQQQIADLIEQSFTLKKQSEHLLEVAKQAVEIAIEKDETVALRYIKQR